ncbi:MAG: hypothetical protein GY832_29740 [Chloroflexi bacterium]|nr:hypothetical protein [Chloroflexota bacterium]
MPIFQVDIQPIGQINYILRNKPKIKLSRDFVQFKFSDIEHDKLQQAIEKGWVYVSGKTEERIATAYYVWCITEERPFVKVTKQRSEKCRCELDTYTTSYNLTEEGMDQVESLFRKSIQFRGRAKKNVILDVGNWSVCNYIPVDKAEEVALSLLEIVNTNRLPVYGT